MESKTVTQTFVALDVSDHSKTDYTAGDYDETESVCDSSSHSIPLRRYPSLAELSSIATNCGGTNLSTFESSMDEKELMLARSTEDCKSQTTNQLNSIWNRGPPVTPPKVAEAGKNSLNQTGDDPLTPTANLKMLVSAASPAIRDRETKKRELFPGESFDTFETLHSAASALISNSRQSDALVSERHLSDESSHVEYGGNKITISRKDKSLGLLCQKFLSKYPEYPKANEFIEIGLDDVARDLNVERRRIYDIVNVLESVEVISRYAKNRYVWHGKSRLPSTLIKLKHYALSKGLKLKPSNSAKENPKSKDMKKEKGKVPVGSALSSQLPLILPKDSNIMSLVQVLKPEVSQMNNNLMPPPTTIKDSAVEEKGGKNLKFKDSEYCRKDKSLGVLSQKFLMMFLVSETRHVTLEDAANVLIGEEEEGQTKYKTKVRRLYDIANILSSLQLIEKVHIHSIQAGRKPGFRWIGIDPDKLELLVPNTQEEVQNPPVVKRICGEKRNQLQFDEDEESALGRFIRRRPSQQQLRPKSEETEANKSKLPRSRSERVLSTKKRGQQESEDGFSVQEIVAAFGVGSSTGSPTEAKFRAELKKLHQQYPDRMSQLLSACSYSDDFEARKSRRSLFMPPKSDVDGAPEPKRRRSADDVYSIRQEADAGFSHSSTSPFKSLPEGKNIPVVGSPKQTIQIAKLNPASPEQKILLERQKQQQLLDEQRGFDSQDERWKRIERELEKAFRKGGPTHPLMVHQSSSPLPYDALVEQTSVAIQASLIDDLSPLKPLSYYRKVKSPWKNTESRHSSCTTSSTSSPVPFQGGAVMNPLSNPHAMSPVPILPATERPASVNNACPNSTYFVQIPISAGGNGGSVVWATPTPPSCSSTPSPDQLIKMAAQPVNAPLLYSPRSLTSTPEPVTLEPSVAGKQQAVITNPVVTMLEPQHVHPVQQTLSIQLPHIGNTEFHSVTPIAGIMTQVQFATPLVKLTDIKSVVSMETPTTTVQLLTDVSKRLSLPFTGEQSA
ncbi:transcription factor E2F7-like isoform X2 [Stylophora pistillata]|uniref:Transcription factor E2F8 n=1 Tax=Stylophora pistillata TaxID=50429 RepID=A0A2B4RGF7_STYPI|nr:transcription factor E2F7-like isoform X2 [Stylophora pistillata]PFX15427.1 Transcription factor E2F8 [Stylophora pistillata]